MLKFADYRRVGFGRKADIVFLKLSSFVIVRLILR